MSDPNRLYWLLLVPGSFFFFSVFLYIRSLMYEKPGVLLSESQKRERLESQEVSLLIERVRRQGGRVEVEQVDEKLVLRIEADRSAERAAANGNTPVTAPPVES